MTTFRKAMTMAVRIWGSGVRPLGFSPQPPLTNYMTLAKHFT